MLVLTASRILDDPVLRSRRFSDDVGYEVGLVGIHM